jgi:hypothetical protein
MADLQVTCITKQNRINSYEAITHLGGNGWWWTKKDVIKLIKDNTHTFHTLVGGKRAEVKIVPGQNGDYLRTQADSVWNDNLLALKDCG